MEIADIESVALLLCPARGGMSEARDKTLNHDVAVLPAERMLVVDPETERQRQTTRRKKEKGEGETQMTVNQLTE
jgi:hypothetical protein